MTHLVLTVEPTVSLVTARDVLNRAQVTGVPVVGKGKVVGIVSKSDLIGVDNPATTPVKQVMTRAIYAVKPEDPAIVAVKLMVDEKLHRVVVVGEQGELAGILTPLDVCRAILQNKPIGLDVSEPLSMKYVSLADLAVHGA